ncbi:MAG TPA: VIT1/CCC1 transporter family protein [Candidatus Angelobacter sp.]|nr:VIT1/CCC1 transporter family protein [Candidatus Angelobacter sp.]
MTDEMPGDRTARLMEDEDARALMAAAEFDHEFLRTHLADERRKASLLGEIREAIFGAQDGLVSTLAVVSTVAGATSDRFTILIAGIASALAGIFSMAAGEYIGSKSQKEIFEAQIVDERNEVHERPGEAEAEIAFMLEEDGLPHDRAVEVARIMAQHPEALLKTMVEKELGLAVESDEGTPLQGALVMGGAFGLGAIPPILPHLLLPGTLAVPLSVAATLAVLFAIGAVKSRWTHRHWLPSGVEIVAIGAVAGIAGYFFGSVLPALLGAPAAAG